MAVGYTFLKLSLARFGTFAACSLCEKLKIELINPITRNNGLFIQITGEDKDDLTIPGAAHGFSTLKAAQAQSDLETLHACGRRVIRLRLAGKAAKGLQELLQITRTATRRL